MLNVKFARFLPAMIFTCYSAQAEAVMHESCPKIEIGANEVGTSSSMTFHIQQVQGRRVLVAEGAITENTPQELQRALTSSSQIEEIWVRSAGGNASAGNEAARIIRAAGLPTRIPSGWWCISSCNFMFFGGVARYIDSGGQFGIHMATAVNSSDFQELLLNFQKGVIAAAQGQDVSNDSLAAFATQQLLSLFGAREQSMAILSAFDVDVLLRMGISRRLLDVMYDQRADDFRDDNGDGQLDIGDAPTFRCLARDELIRYNVVNTE